MKKIIKVTLDPSAPEGLLSRYTKPLQVKPPACLTLLFLGRTSASETKETSLKT